MEAQAQVFPSGVQPDNYRSPGEAMDMGITIRDYIAIKAMAAIISHPGMERYISREGVAQLAYEFTDALITQSNIPKDK